ncbi:xylulokinase [Oceanibium sediminis]|uniref:xylulokinase n=1 Tax=Oceanibium sediminis TaxID=2026339 RepID=UPI000DD49D4A|nr:xylulokinase [Oceanibium sediminis]
MYIGLDLGTSGVKALLMDDTQAVVAEAQAPLSVSRPKAGWSEQTPADWIAATGTALEALAAKAPLGGVRGIGLSGQMHGTTLIDRAGDVLRPCMLWNDTRSFAEAAEMDATPPWREVSGNIVFPGFTAPKVEWVRRNEPEIFERIALVLLPKDYLRLWLTGEAVSEMSDAAGTGWLDVGARDWSDELLAASGLVRANMPRLIEGSQVSGTMRDSLADRFGLPKSVIVAGGGGDNAASAVGVGVVRAGDAFVSLGTSGVLFAANDAYRPDPASAVHTFCHAVPDTWHQMGVILSATDALEWYARLLGRTAADLTGALGDLRPPGRATFLPYLGGERTPHNDAQIRGAMIGLDHSADAEALTRAVLEGVTFALADCHAALSATGTQIRRLIAVGGGSRSDYWLEAIATALDLEIEVPVAGDFGGAFGAARLAMMADTGDGGALATPPKIDHRVAPNAALRDAFAEAHARYRATYTALKGLS